jgi:isopentenyl-diphosphate delta-isomerase
MIVLKSQYNRMIFVHSTTNSFMQNRQVVLVDEFDQELGTADIYEAHQGEGKKHRALSVILYRKKDGKIELLHQQRAVAKPVFKLLWSNTCCTNLRPGDEYLPRAVSRLEEEMGIKIAQDKLRPLYGFSYEAPDLTAPGWCENEHDTVIVGEWDGEIVLNPQEAADYKWIEWESLQKDVRENPDSYSPWHKMILNEPRFVREVIHG